MADPQPKYQMTPVILKPSRPTTCCYCDPTLPPGWFSKEDNYPSCRCKQVQHLANVYWRCWIREYLPTLRERRKWANAQRNFSVNNIVLVLDERVPLRSWPLGRVLEVYRNRGDGLVRSVKVKTRSSVLVQPSDKIVLLEAAWTWLTVLWLLHISLFWV